MRQNCNVVTPVASMASLPELQLAEKARPAGINSYRSTQRGVDGVAHEIRTWLAGTRWLRQERA